MTDYVAPEITSLTPTASQQCVIDGALLAIRDDDAGFWKTGRQSGKSTVRAMIAQALLDEDEHNPYKVVPIHYSTQRALGHD